MSQKDTVAPLTSGFRGEIKEKAQEPLTIPPRRPCTSITAFSLYVDYYIFGRRGPEVANLIKGTVAP